MLHTVLQPRGAKNGGCGSSAPAMPAPTPAEVPNVGFAVLGNGKLGAAVKKTKLATSWTSRRIRCKLNLIHRHILTEEETMEVAVASTAYAGDFCGNAVDNCEAGKLFPCRVKQGAGCRLMGASSRQKGTAKPAVVSPPGGGKLSSARNERRKIMAFAILRKRQNESIVKEEKAKEMAFAGPRMRRRRWRKDRGRLRSWRPFPS
jgi:hypothetical protein